MASPKPNSARLNTCNIDVNKPFNPRYSFPNLYIIIVLIINGQINVIIFSIKPHIIFTNALLVLPI